MVTSTQFFLSENLSDQRPDSTRLIPQDAAAALEKLGFLSANDLCSPVLQEKQRDKDFGWLEYPNPPSHDNEIPEQVTPKEAICLFIFEDFYKLPKCLFKEIFLVIIFIFIDPRL
jgi:hypothetical protein